MSSFSRTCARSRAMQGNQNARKRPKPVRTIAIDRLADLADRCTAAADRCSNDAHSLQWRFAGIVLRFIADDATLPPNDPRRQEWDSTYGFLREHNRRVSVSSPAP